MNGTTDIKRLVENFREQIESYKKGNYNETQLRREYLDPFFAALGWDIENKDGYAEAYKDVVHEDAIKVGGATKAPDYSFRIGGVRKFFVEAKKPSVNIKEDVSPAYQLRRYAWSAKLPISILTDFEEFAVYDCRKLPKPNDKASTGRILYTTYDKFLEQWDEIAGIFSREAILKGAFDKYADSKKTRGTAEVDDEFLKEMEAWRESLAKNIAFKNSGLSIRELNHAVQLTIDRIVFLRICEDRGIEPYGKLQALLNGKNVYERLTQLFMQADDKYNSGLFHFTTEKGRPGKPDSLTPKLEITDAKLKDIIKRLYYPDSPYEFAVFSGDILGQVYERFLGKVIVPKGRGVDIEEKPEVRKAGGVYYTPTYIVDYIVKNTVGKLVDGKTPKKVEKLHILDPACGSGSFLIGAYQYLLDWHRDWYATHEPKKHAKGKNPKVFLFRENDWRLTTSEKKRILLNNIYGVDIDTQAVEVTKLALLLKVLEGESEETLLKQFQLFKERALPDLRANIKCGNSLIGPDFYEGKELSLFGEEEQYRINVFDWEREFAHVLKQGGFDAVIGNPPYVRIQTTKQNEINYYNYKYKTAIGNYDIYCLFTEKGYTLLNSNGSLCFIMPHRYLKTDYGKGLRKFITEKNSLNKIIDFDGYMVFKSASINTCITQLVKNKGKNFIYGQLHAHNEGQELIDSFLKESLAGKTSSQYYTVGQIIKSTLSEEPWVFIWPHEETVWNKMNSMNSSLGDATTHIFQGLKTSADNIYIMDYIKTENGKVQAFSKHLNKEFSLEEGILKPLVKGGQMRRHRIEQHKKIILFPYMKGKLISSIEMQKQYPSCWEYLNECKDYLERRERGRFRGNEWYQYGRSQALNVINCKKILVPDYYARASYCLDSGGNYYFCGGGAGGYGIVLKEGNNYEYILGLLNSKLLDWYLHKISMRAYQTAYMYVKKYISQLPIRTIDFDDAEDVKKHDRMVGLVEQMLDLNKKLPEAKTDHDKNLIQRQIDYTDSEIDKLVYELYGLTEEEIKIVEGE